MYEKFKEAFANLAILAVSLAVCFIALETVVFRWLLKPDDVLPNVTLNTVVRYQPNTTAFFRHPDGRETRATVNANGWNSVLAKYAFLKNENQLRIAVVGDSYVHGAFVDVQDGFPEVLRTELQRYGRKTQVLRFGMDGAPMSQYLHMVREEVIKYRPDIVVIPLIHNDFDESYRFLKTRYASSFLKIRIDDAGKVEEIPPADFQPGIADVLRRSATFRYLYYETNLYLKLKSLVSRYFWGGDEDYSPEHIQSAVDIRKIKDHKRNEQAARYVMSELKELAQLHGFKLLFVMDGVREAIYDEDKRLDDYEVAKLNKMARKVTSELALPFLDLQDAFDNDYAKNSEYLEYDYDWHWNRRGNWLVGRTIAERLILDRYFHELPEAQILNKEASLQ